MDRPEATVTPNMVAVGNSVIPGTISTHNANLQAALSQCPIPIWRPRDGRNSVFVFWEAGPPGEEMDVVWAGLYSIVTAGLYSKGRCVNVCE